jgi:acetoin utilization deacetylase AcuC-like enzyme
VRFVYGDAYKFTVPGVPLDRMRAERILAFLVEEGLLEREDIALPRQPSLRNLLRAHDAAYLETLSRPDEVQRVFGVAVTDELLENVLDSQRLMVGGTIQATRLALSTNGVAVNLGGGLHHARRDTGQAFCIFNDVAVAIARLRARGYSEPILVVDLDLHDGDGTRSIFAQDPSVHTFSIHNEHWGDTEAEASTAIALGGEVTDELYLGTLLKALPEVVDQVRPGLVVYIAGTDPAHDDTLGNWQITAQGMLSRDRFVLEQARSPRRPVPVVVVLGGGYGDRSWTYSARCLSWLLAGRPIEPPDNEEQTLLRFRRIWRTLDPVALTSEPGDFSWRLTDADLAGIVPGAPRRTRFLGFFSRHGLELVLERFGIFDLLRMRGFDHPTVELDLDHPLGQRLRVWGGPERTELLVELRVDRSQRVIPGMELMVIEWLLLQNPRAQFGPYRRPLPGQQHPGLGMLEQFFGWLVVVCEMLELDGVFYRSSHYHLAALSHRLVRFLEPEHEARYRSLQRLLGDTPVPEASRRLSEGRVVDRRSGEPLEWHADPMVLPVSDRLRERVQGDAYDQRVDEALARLDLASTE